MNTTLRRFFRSIATALLVGALLPATTSWAHCDTLDGPVIAAAKQALVNSDLTPVLRWVKAGDEAEIRTAFERTLAVRKTSEPAAALADQWFFETLVRVHRAGEGAPYSGLKSEAAGEPGIEPADHALASGDFGRLTAETTGALNQVLQGKFERVKALQSHADHSVAAGREYVAAYVDYIHFVSRIAALSASGVGAHEPHQH